MFRKNACFVYQAKATVPFYSAGSKHSGIRQFHENLLHEPEPAGLDQFPERLERNGAEGVGLSHHEVRANGLGDEHIGHRADGGNPLQEQGAVQLDGLQRENDRDLSLRRYSGPPGEFRLRRESTGKTEGGV